VGRREVHKGFWWASEGKNHLEDPGVDGKIILKMDLQEVGWGHGVD
jgi:hypothetical protein